MVKICSKCGCRNPDDAFWCIDCNNRLLENIIEKETYTPDEKTPEKPIQHNEKIDYAYEDKISKMSLNFSVFKIPFALIFVGVLIFAAWYFVSNIGETNFDWDKFGGCPWDESNLPWDALDFPGIEQFTMDNVYNSNSPSHEFVDIGILNEDYWFEGDSIKTKSGWTYSITKVQDCNYDAIVLDYYVYNNDNSVYDDVEDFSPIDIYLGFDDVVDNPNKYPYEVVSNFYRGVYVQAKGSALNNEYLYAHQTNTHIIPHNQNVINNLYSIDSGDIIHLTGSYVNLYGTRPGESLTYSWTTDTVIGNSNCEVILVDSIEYI